MPADTRASSAHNDSGKPRGCFMGHHHFAVFTRALRGVPSRRAVLRGLVGRVSTTVSYGARIPRWPGTSTTRSATKRRGGGKRRSRRWRRLHSMPSAASTSGNRVRTTAPSVALASVTRRPPRVSNTTPMSVCRRPIAARWAHRSRASPTRPIASASARPATPGSALTSQT